MGLDLVEMVMRIEEEFETEIPDEVAVTFTTPRKVIDYLVNLPNIKEKRHPREYISDKVWRIIEDEAGVDRTDYYENSRFIEDMGMD